MLQDLSLRRLLKDVALRLANPKAATKSLKAQLKKFERDRKRLRGLFNAAIAVLPESLLADCPSSFGGVVRPFDFSAITRFAGISLDIYTTARRVVKLRLAIKAPGGKCEGTQAECRERARLRAELAKEDIAYARQIHLSNLAILKLVPKVTYSCK